MSDSYTIVPLDQQTREWLIGEGHGGVPDVDGREATLGDLKAAFASIAGLSVEWSADCATLQTPEGYETQLLMDGPVRGDDEQCKFHFRGGDDEQIESLMTALARIVGPLVVISHSGEFTKLAYEDCGEGLGSA